MNNTPAKVNSECARLSTERSKHREWIGGRAVTLLSHYWRDDDPTELTAALGADWADVLEGIPAEYIQRACIQYQRDEPRRKPSPAAVYSIAKAMMPRPEVVRHPEPPRPEPCSAEAAQEIVNRAGFKPRRF